ncbi:hypothetical protein RND81_09G103600 [Saponaria officinalis]|uniref:Retrotransposon Copia-like N-terminal domain-containing protein n=1 Tax=Saponaria officinalis TaxID=3572 RepID=A0AAW1IL25_SAPOF
MTKDGESPHPSKSSSPPIHPAFSAGNIYSHVKTTLTLQDSEYRTWRHVFMVHCGSYGVQGHLTGKSTPIGDDDEKWQQLDYLVQSWIFTTISVELFTMVCEPDATAHDI